MLEDKIDQLRDTENPQVDEQIARKVSMQIKQDRCD